MESKKSFFLGKLYDLNKKAMQPDLVHYDSADLTTHAVILGMTGSGKTGLGVGILEEAALDGIPAIIIDPKGDLTNLILHFPNLAPEDFQPWIDQDAARREGISVEQAAEKTAANWQKGLADWGMDRSRIEALKNNVAYTIFTPGSDAGKPVSVLASLRKPEINWDENKEVLRERITSTVTALLGLVGFKDIDPVRSREHILLANIFEHFWSHAEDLDLEKLILSVQTPPFEKLGVFPLARFYPDNDRFDLAMLLNNFLASPSFQAWLEGQPLDISTLLYTPEGKPRHSIFYLAHLGDAERMFFVTLLYAAIETWMRTQTGTSSLRALVYFDEIAGYLPPIANPPSKPIILRMVKQARAFGIGLILATQNPIDLDYKALSNTGTWMIGKLQADQDKARLLDGLEGLTAGIDRAGFDRMISQLQKRTFLLHNVHAKAPIIFQTRWAINYLAGPLTRTQIPALNKLANAAQATSATAATPASAAQPPVATSTGTAKAKPAAAAMPPIPANVPVYYLPVSTSVAEALKAAATGLSETPAPQVAYQPVMAGQAKVLYENARWQLQKEVTLAVQAEETPRGIIPWDDYLAQSLDPKQVGQNLQPQVSFLPLKAWMNDPKQWLALQKNFVDWIYRTQQLTLKVNDVLKVAGTPDMGEEAFETMLLAAWQKAKNADIAKINGKYEKQLLGLNTKLTKEKLELERDKQRLSNRKMEEVSTGLDTVLGLVGGRKRKLSTSITKRRLTSDAKAEVEESVKMIADLEAQLKQVQAAQAAELATAEQHWETVKNQTTEMSVSAVKKNIFVEIFGILWLPYYVFEQDGQAVNLPAFKTA